MTAHPNAHILAKLAEIARTDLKPWNRLEVQDEHADFAARQSVTDALRLTAKLAASYLTEAADTIENLRAQLAEAQGDAERLDWIIEHRAYVVSDPDCCDGYWLNYMRPDGTVWTQATEHETPRAAIDAAKGPA